MLRRLVIVTTVTLALCVGAGTAFGYWAGFNTTLDGIGAGAAGSINQGAVPTPVSHGSHIDLTWGTSTLTTGQTVDGYIVKRYDAETNMPQTMLSDCTATIDANICTERDVPAGLWRYTVTPVVADNWQGPESDLSGVAQAGGTGLALDRSVVGPPLPTSIGGTVSGFSPNEGIAFELDHSTALTGSPSSVGSDGAATISGLTIPAATADGTHTISAIGDAPGDPSQADASILVDTTPPVIHAFTTPLANAAGWNNTSPVEVNGTVDDGDGSGISYVKYTDDGTNPKTSPTSQYALAPPSATSSTTYKFYGVDLAGNESSVETLEVKIDTLPPYFTIELADFTGHAFITATSPEGSPGQAYYRGDQAGSFRFKVNALALGGSPTVSAGFTPLSADTAGFSFDSSSITTPAGGPYLSNPLSWVAGSTSTPSGTITVLDAAGNSFGDAGSITNDSAAPSGGSVDATGLVGAGGRYSTSLTLDLNLAKGTDAAVGLANGSATTDLPAQLLRASGPLGSGDGVANGTCGAYGAYLQVGSDDPGSTLSDTVPADATCYRYRYEVADHLGNVAIYESPDIKVKTTPTPSLRPTDATIDAVSGVSSQAVSGSTVYYNPSSTGSFSVASTATAPFVGIQRLTFPTIAGFSGGGVVTSPTTATSFQTTYSWSANGSDPSPGPQPISATDNAGNTATNDTAVAVVKDTTPPSGGSIDATGLGGTGGRYSTSTTLSIGFSPGSDTESGLLPTGRKLSRSSASLTSNGTANGSCGAFGAYTQVGADDPVTPKADTVPVDRVCYRYRYVVPDKVGNQAVYTSPDIKVDAATPPAPALSFSNLSNASWSGTGTAVFYRPAAASGGFTVNATSADTTSGTTGFSFPTLPAGWSDTSGGPGIRNYSWNSPNPGVPSGAQTVTAANNAGGHSSSTFTATVTSDGTPPSGGSVTYPNGYSTASSLNVILVKGTDTGSGLATNSGILQRSSATLDNGSCGSFTAFSTVATNPSSPAIDPVSSDTCFKYRYLISDNVGNQATYTSANIVKVDRGFPTDTVTLLDPMGAVTAFNAASLYYKGDTPGSFKFVNIVGDTGSGPASSIYPDVATAGWTHNAETVTAPAGGPYISSTYSWTANPTNPGVVVITGKDAAGNGWNKAVNFSNDSLPPVSGSIGYTNGVVNATAVPVSLNIGTDNAGGSGVDPTTSVVKRDVAPLTTATETCGTFPGSFNSTITLVGGADTSVSSGNCYQYRYIVYDKVGNVTTYTSASVAKVDTNGPRVTSIVSQQSGGGAGNGQLQVGDRLLLTFNQNLANASVPTSFTGATETRGQFSTVTLNVPGLTNGAVDTGSTGYLQLPTTTATFSGNVSLSNSGTNTLVTIAVTALSGGTTSSSNGVLNFAPASTINDSGSNSATGSFSTVNAFKLF